MFDDIVYLLEQLHTERKRMDPPLTLRVRPKVTIDASLIGYKYLTSSLHPSDSVFLISRALAKRNIDVLIICDPPTRHHSKRAHHQRVGRMERNKLQLMIRRIELLCSGDDAEKITTITRDIQKLEKADNRLSLPADFSTRLHILHNDYQPQLGKGEITIETAPFQADPSIADVAIRGECEAIISGDSDFAMYVGPSGPDGLGDIMFRDIKINQRQSTITSGIVITGQSNVANKIMEFIASRESSTVFPVEPKFPLFDGVSDPRTRALIAIALGCDALPGGVPGVGASSLRNLLDKCNWNNPSGVHVDFAVKLANQKRALVKDPQALLCIANSLIFEKTNSETGYMYEIPRSLESYNKEFSAPETDIFPGPHTVVCKGCDGQEHIFLEAEGVSTCMTCKASLCRFCTWIDSTDESSELLCLSCKQYSLAVNSNQKSEREMREYLKDNAVNVPVTASYAEVLELYRRFDDNEHAIFAEDIRNVKYPLLPTMVLNQFPESSNDIERMKTVKVREIGHIIRSIEVVAPMIVGLVRILASITDIPARRKCERLSATHAISKNLVNMARQSRIHTSQRLMERSLRHATDKASPNILHGTITLGVCNHSDCAGDTCCIILENSVRASMKNIEYKTKSAITQHHFVATECTCRAGCTNEPSPNIEPSDIGTGKIICSHGMTLPVSLSLTLYKGLAAHILSELRFRLLRDDFEVSLDAAVKSIFRNDVSSLMKAAGIFETALDPNRKILECLEVFAVGTDLPKLSPSPRPHDLGLLREKCRYDRAMKVAEEVILLKKENEVAQQDGINLTESMEPTISEEYLRSQQAIDALSLVFDRQEFQSLQQKRISVDDYDDDYNSSDDNDSDDDGNENEDDIVDDEDNCIHNLPVGFELLRDRAQPHLLKIEYNERNKATTTVAEQWEVALLEWTSVRGLQIHDFKPPCSPVKKCEASRKRKADGNVVSAGFAHNYCCIRGCQGNGVTKVLKRIADYPPELPDDASTKRRITHAIKKFMRRERTERAGKGRLCAETNLRACEDHWEDVEGKYTKCMLPMKDGTMESKSICIPTFSAPRRVGDKSFGMTPKTLSRGNAADRATIRHVVEMSTNEFALAQQQVLEMMDVSARKQNLEQINPTILAAAGLAVHIDNKYEQSKENVGDRVIAENNQDYRREPTFKLNDLVPKQVKRRTGFRDLKLLLSYVAVICGGDLTKMTRTNSVLTWLEEWFLCFELLWGRTLLRFVDYPTIYCCREKTLRIIVQRKLQLIKATRDKWPMYASFAEDAKFRDPKWNAHFDPINGHRVVMHDSTNIPLAQPSSAALQRALYNPYYGMCCAKAGVAVQLCGYIYGLPLNTGHSDDTRFIEDTDILKQQQIFAESDETSDKPFLNIFDKGYQCVVAALNHGQYCLQPAFAESEKQFKDNAVLHSGAVAVVRSGNERAVNRCKMSWFLKRGAVDQMWSIDLVCDVWDAWTFQVNFMYKKFL